MTSIIPATVRIVDLPLAATISGGELIEAVQTVGGVGNSVQVSLSNVFGAIGGLPISGATGQFLQKTGVSNFSATWANIAANVLASTGLAQSGSTTVALSLASTAGLSVLGVGGTGSAVPAPITGTADQVLVVNHAGNTASFGAVNLATTAAVTGVLPNSQYSSVNLAAGNVAGGVQGLLPPGNLASTGGNAGQLLAINPAGTTVQFVSGMVLLNTLSPNNVSTIGDTTSISAAFRNYMFTFENVCPTGSAAFLMQVATTGNSFIGANYVSMNQVISSAIVYQFNHTGGVLLSGNNASTDVSTSTLYGVNGFVKMFNPNATTFRKQIVGETSYLASIGASGTTTISQCVANGYYDGASSPVSAVQFLFSGSFSIQTGTIRVYGF